jgi:hypothetical protein
MPSSSNSSNTRAMHVRLCQMGAGFFAAGLIGFLVLQVATARMNATAEWPSARGRIIGSEETTGVVKIGRSWRAQRMADVRYAYVVNGQRYEGDGFRVLPMFHLGDETPQEIVARYPVGMTVAVYYDPKDPADALLKPEPAEGVRSFIRSFTFISGFLAFLGVVMLGSGAMHVRAYDRALRNAAAEARRAPAAPAPLATPATASPVSAAPAAAVPSRPTHWLFRLASTLLGLFLLMMGSLLAVTAAKTSNPAVSRAVEVACMVLFAAMALGGGYLVARGTRRPTVG